MAETAAIGVSAREIMTGDVVVAAPDQRVEDVARELIWRRISGMPVLDDAGTMLGVVSEYDIITKRGQRVADIMSRGVISVPDDADARHIAGIMGLHGIGRVPVLRDGKVVGIVSRSDMVRLFAQVHWQCPQCGFEARGFARPDRCQECGEIGLQLERDSAQE